MVSALDSGTSGPGSRYIAGDIALCSWAYKLEPANLMLGVTLRWTSMPSRGE